MRASHARDVRFSELRIDSPDRPEGRLVLRHSLRDRSSTPPSSRRPRRSACSSFFAELIGVHLDAIDRLRSSEASLADERKTAELREQFIAVLGHDLRNPLSAIIGSADLLLQSP